MSYCIYLRKSRADTELERLGEGETLARHKRTLLSLAQSKSYAIGEIYEEISDASMLVLEANHDEHLLMYGEYPYHLKQRIKL